MKSQNIVKNSVAFFIVNDMGEYSHSGSNFNQSGSFGFGKVSKSTCLYRFLKVRFSSDTLNKIGCGSAIQVNLIALTLHNLSAALGKAWGKLGSALACTKALAMAEYSSKLELCSFGLTKSFVLKCWEMKGFRRLMSVFPCLLLYFFSRMAGVNIVGR